MTGPANIGFALVAIVLSACHGNVVSHTRGGSLAAEITKSPIPDFTTPEGAILMQMEGWKTHSLEAIVRAHDFTMQAIVTLREVSHYETNAVLLEKMAESSMSNLRAEFQCDFLPDFDGVTQTFPQKAKYMDDPEVWAVTHVCTYPKTGDITYRSVLVGKTVRGWRVLKERSIKEAEQSAALVPGSRGTPPADAGAAPQDPAGEP
jgi:hypothetical protein